MEKCGLSLTLLSSINLKRLWNTRWVQLNQRTTHLLPATGHPDSRPAITRTESPEVTIEKRKFDRMA